MFSVITALGALQMILVNVCSQKAVYKPPSIVDPDGPKTLYFQENDTVNLTCKANGQPLPTYTWSMNGTLIMQGRQVNFNAITGVLTIPNFDKRHDGVYTCRAHTTIQTVLYGTVVASNIAPPVTLYEARIGHFTDKPPVRMTVAEYSYGYLPCNNKGETVTSTIYHNWFVLPNRTSVRTESGRLFIDSAGNLHISYVLPKDAVPLYMCTISSAEIKTIYLGSQMIVAVSPVSNIVTAIKPQLRYSNSGVQVRRFEDARLECFFSGYDPAGPLFPVTHWYDTVGKEIINHGTKYSVSNDSRVLKIKSVSEKDEGYYLCDANNSAGEATLVMVFLNVTSAPILIDGGPRDQTVSENATAVFECKARSAFSEMPPKPPVWYINGEKIGPHTNVTKFKLSGDKTTLAVVNVQKPRDILCVQCEVINHVGTTWGTACLNVILPITVIRRPALRQEITHGDSVDLTVTATTDPLMTLYYRWELRNKSYVLFDHPPFMTYDPTSNKATINTSSLTTDEFRTVGGVYSRFIYHIYETKIVNIEVVLRDMKPESLGLYIKLDHAIVIFVSISNITILIIIAAITCCKRKGDHTQQKSLEQTLLKHENITRPGHISQNENTTRPGHISQNENTTRPGNISQNQGIASPTYFNTSGHHWEAISQFTSQEAAECQGSQAMNNRFSLVSGEHAFYENAFSLTKKDNRNINRCQHGRQM